MMQHVIYENVNEEQMEKLKVSNEMDLLSPAKFGQSFKLQNKMIRPVYFEDRKSVV